MCVNGQTDREVTLTEIHDFWGEALVPHLCTFKPPALLETEVGDTLREVLDIACVQVFVSGL